MIRLGVMGHGGRISGMIKSVFRAVNPDVRVVAIVDPDEAGARSRLAECDQKDVKFYRNVKEMMRQAKPDALAVGTRCNLHAPYGVEAAAYDLPLFLEKPVAVSMPQAVSLERAFEKSKCPVVVSFPLRVSPLCVITRQFIQEGAIGDPEHVLAANYVPYGICYWEAGYRNYAVTQGLFLQKATHDLDYLMYLMGSNIVRVAAMWNLGRIFGGKKAAGLRCSKCKETETCLESPENRKRNGSGGAADHLCLFSVDCGSPRTGTNEDSSSALLEFASGAHGVYTQVFYSRRDAATRGATVSGYMGTLSFDWYTNQLRRVRHHSPFSDTVKAGAGLSHFGGDIELGRDFIDLIQGKIKASRTPILTGVQSAYACLAARESAKTGKYVKVRQVGQA